MEGPNFGAVSYAVQLIDAWLRRTRKRKTSPPPKDDEFVLYSHAGFEDASKTEPSESCSGCHEPITGNAWFCTGCRLQRFHEACFVQVALFPCKGCGCTIVPFGPLADK